MKEITEVMEDIIKPYIDAGDTANSEAIDALSQGTIFGFYINGDESDPDEAVSYIKDAVGMTPAAMDYTNDTFSYGSWENAFFMPKPCFLLPDGTVDFYLDSDDYTLREDGSTPSHINHLGNIETSSTAANSYAIDDYLVYNDTLYIVTVAITAGDTLTVGTNISAASNAPSDVAGNFMMEWGQNDKKIWLRIVPSSDTHSAHVYISDYQVTEDFRDWSFHNCDGESVSHFYTPIFNGYVDANSVMRSIGGVVPSKSLTGTAEIAYAQANNPGSDEIWNIECYADRVLINMLLVLMAKSLDTQTAFGQGATTSGTEAISATFYTGEHNAQGLFYGTNSGTVASSSFGNIVKVFGMENYWGYQWRRTNGLILADGVTKVKLTYGTEDGSEVSGYNTDGTDYITMTSTAPTGTSGSYISEAIYTEDGCIPNVASGTSSTYYCDGLWYNTSGSRFALFGGYSGSGALCGAFCCYLNRVVSNAAWHIGAALSCKPLE